MLKSEFVFKFAV